jgi:hypothetical protein
VVCESNEILVNPIMPNQKRQREQGNERYAHTSGGRDKKTCMVAYHSTDGNSNTNQYYEGNG